jgi:hypothetical protein
MDIKINLSQIPYTVIEYYQIHKKVRKARKMVTSIMWYLGRPKYNYLHILHTWIPISFVKIHSRKFLHFPFFSRGSAFGVFKFQIPNSKFQIPNFGWSQKNGASKKKEGKERTNCTSF